MTVRKIPLVENEIYHIIIRGVEGINIFRDLSDYKRFMQGLYEFNNDNPVEIWLKIRNIKVVKRYISSNQQKREKRDELVEILAFCLMPNHIHLLLRQKTKDGITKFMRKIGTGYANYFNKKYKRSGYVFQGRFKSICIKTNEQLKTIFVYIHTNPAIIKDKNWKTGNIKNPKQIINYIENYKWSSYPDYLSNNNFSFIINKNLFSQTMSKKEWQEFVNDWIKSGKSVFPQIV